MKNQQHTCPCLDSRVCGPAERETEGRSLGTCLVRDILLWDEQTPGLGTEEREPFTRERSLSGGGEVVKTSSLGSWIRSRPTASTHGWRIGWRTCTGHRVTGHDEWPSIPPGTPPPSITPLSPRSRYLLTLWVPPPVVGRTGTRVGCPRTTGRRLSSMTESGWTRTWRPLSQKDRLPVTTRPGDESTTPRDPRRGGSHPGFDRPDPPLLQWR